MAVVGGFGLAFVILGIAGAFLITGGGAVTSFIIGFILGKIVETDAKEALVDSARRVRDDQEERYKGNDELLLEAERRFQAAVLNSKGAAKIWFWAVLVFPATIFLYFGWKVLPVKYREWFM